MLLFFVLSKLLQGHEEFAKNTHRVRVDSQSSLTAHEFGGEEPKLEFESQRFARQSLPVHRQPQGSLPLLFPKNAQWLWHWIHRQML